MKLGSITGKVFVGLEEKYPWCQEAEMHSGHTQTSHLWPKFQYCHDTSPFRIPSMRPVYATIIGIRLGDMVFPFPCPVLCGGAPNPAPRFEVFYFEILKKLLLNV